MIEHSQHRTPTTHPHPWNSSEVVHTKHSRSSRGDVKCCSINWEGAEHPRRVVYGWILQERAPLFLAGPQICSPLQQSVLHEERAGTARTSRAGTEGISWETGAGKIGPYFLPYCCMHAQPARHGPRRPLLLAVCSDTTTRHRRRKKKSNNVLEVDDDPATA